VGAASRDAIGVSFLGPSAIVEWDSVDDAVAFYKSKAWNVLYRRWRA
jgi:hypothetical protein